MPSGATSPLRLSQQPAINFKGCSGYFSQTDNTFPNRSDKSGNTHKFDHIMRYIWYHHYGNVEETCMPHRNILHCKPKDKRHGIIRMYT